MRLTCRKTEAGRAIAILSLVSLVLAVLAAPVATEAQRPPKTYRIGILSPDIDPPGMMEEFRQGLQDRGYVEGKTLAIESRHAGGRNERLAAMADELVRLGVDVIVAINTPAAHAAKNATTAIPIVITRVSDPVKTDLVSSFSRPSGNIPGLSFQPEETSVKRLQLLKEAIPTVSRIAVLWYTGNAGPAITVNAIETASPRLGVQLIKLPVRSPTDLAGGFQTASFRRGDVLFVVDDVFLTTHRGQILELAAKHMLPVVSQYKEFAEIGGLMAMGRAPVTCTAVPRTTWIKSSRALNPRSYRSSNQRDTSW